VVLLTRAGPAVAAVYGIQEADGSIPFGSTNLQHKRSPRVAPGSHINGSGAAELRPYTLPREYPPMVKRKLNQHSGRLNPSQVGNPCQR